MAEGSLGRSMRCLAVVAMMPAVTLTSHAWNWQRPPAGWTLVQAHSGMHGQGHDRLHSWYKTLRQPFTGYSCCDNTDCRPTTARVHGKTIEVLVDGEWTRVPFDKILKRKSPDLNTHVCAPKGPWSPKVIFCVVLGFGV